ncbi:MAG: hypothetical protein V4555_11375 [Acidobacteriota bacterium]
MSFLSSWIFWKYERGSVQYDVMVTLILAFIFVTPRFIDFKDKPAPVVPIRTSEVLVKSAGTEGDASRYIYEVRSEDLSGATTDADLRSAMARLIQPISGDVTIQKIAPVFDTKGHIVAYDATVLR